MSEDIEVVDEVGADVAVADVAPTEPTDIEYKFTTADGFEETDELKSVYASAAEALKGSGVPLDKAQGLLDAVFNTLSGLDTREKEAMNERLEVSKAELKNEWGNSFEANLDKCNKLVLFADGGEPNGAFEAAIRESGINRDARFVKGLLALSSKFSEDNFVQKGASIQTPDSIKAEINALMSKPEYTDASLTGHNELVNQVFELRQKLFN